jgi:hypothetical protein
VRRQRLGTAVDRSRKKFRVALGRTGARADGEVRVDSEREKCVDLCLFFLRNTSQTRAHLNAHTLISRTRTHPISINTFERLSRRIGY